MKINQSILWSCLFLTQSVLAMATESPRPIQDQNHQDMAKSKSPQDTMAMGEMHEMVMPFFTHMGMPEPFGSHSLNLSGLSTSAGGRSTPDLSFQYMCGLSDRLGFNFRSDEFTTGSEAEVMFTYASIRSADRMSGICPMLELEFPTKRSGSGIKTIVGFSSTVAQKNGTFDGAFHYNTSERKFEGSVSYVSRACQGFYPIFELIGTAELHQMPTLDILVGPKFKTGKNSKVGIAYQSPISDRKDYGSRFIVQFDFRW